MYSTCDAGGAQRRPINFRADCGRPCPVCDTKTKGCSATEDGFHFCRGEPTAGWRQVGSGPDPAGFHHYRRDDGRRQDDGGPRDWPAIAARYAVNLTESRKAEQAALLGLPPEAFDQVPQAGWVPRQQALTFPERDASGTVVGVLKRYPATAGPARKKQMKGGRRGLILPSGWRDCPGPVFLVEGPTDSMAASLAGLAAVGRPSNTGGGVELAALLKSIPADRAIVVVGENDRAADGNWPGRDGARAVARALARRLRRPVRSTLPPVGSKYVREWLTSADQAGLTWVDRGAKLADLLVEAAECDGPEAPAGGRGGDECPDGAPAIVVATDEHRVNREAAAALAAEGDLYQRGGLLVQVVPAPGDPDLTAAVRRPPGSPVVRELPPPLLRERLTRCARWVKETGGDEKPVHPPAWCVNAVHVRGSWPGVRPLEAVVTHPVILADGTILASDGYDRRSGLFLAIPGGIGVHVPDRPAPADARAAAETLLEVVTDFPFESDAHRSAWLAALLTPLAQFSYPGPAPLFLFDKNIRAAGAGLLADTVALTLTGRRFPVMAYTNDKEELRKKITSLAVEGERLVLLDNLSGPVGCDVLDLALTADRWKDRLLGGNRVYDGPLNVTWYGTGNNVLLVADTPRRVCHIRMESGDERPELRTDFRHRDLRAHVLANRSLLLSAALTLLRAWFVTGRPRHGLSPWGSFERWSNVVREAVVFAGLPDPGATRRMLETVADRDEGAMLEILSALERLDPTGRGLTVAEVIDRVKTLPPAAPDWLPELRSAIEELCGKLDGRSLGCAFRHYKRRNLRGKVLDQAHPDHGSNRWVVRAAGDVWVRREDVPHTPHVPPDGGGGGDDGRDPDADDSPPYRDGRLFEDFSDQLLPD